ncbi:hypothetical protein SAXI111661_03105 [Saccharomonospora xinjiangensis]|nr:hypothetical protein EYD13_07415 [Saccharomonospora xinjiangensis]
MGRAGWKVSVVTLALAVFGTIPPTASATGPRPVDPAAGPVAFANIASLAVTDDGYGRPGGSVISETQRSPLTPGRSRLGADRTAVPGSEGERAAVGPNYRLAIERHDVTAGLDGDRVPEATALADFVLTDLASGVTVLSFERAATSARCASARSPEVAASAASLSLVGSDGVLRRVRLPEPGGEVRGENLPFGASVEIGEDEAVTSDIRIREVTGFDELLRQRQWRDGDVTAASGWLVEIDTRVRPSAKDGAARGEPPLPEEVTGTTEAEAGSEKRRRVARTVETTLVLGGVSCSVPHEFTPGGNEQAGSGAPSVPVAIPAGVGTQAGAGPEAVAQGGTRPAVSPATVWGTALLAGGGVLGLAALLLARRAGTARARS